MTRSDLTDRQTKVAGWIIIALAVLIGVAAALGWIGR